VNRTLIAAIVPLMAAACAPRATRVASDTAPRLVGCSGFQTEVPRSTNFNTFAVTVKVSQTGSVVPGSGEVATRRLVRGNGQRAQDARAMAETCTFEPAMHNGVAVEGRARVTVSIPQSGV
jgi:hypothetical protein